MLWTPIDGLSTMLLMNLTDEAEEARQLICDSLDVRPAGLTSVFDTTIRVIGGLVSAYTLYQKLGYQDGRATCLLDKARALGDGIMPALAGAPGIWLPYPNIDLSNGVVTGTNTVTSMVGTSIVELAGLSYWTGDFSYMNQSKTNMLTLWKLRSGLNLLGEILELVAVQNPQDIWSATVSHLQGDIDSAIEYQLKCWLLFGDDDCHDMWWASYAAAQKYLAIPLSSVVAPEQGNLWYGRVDMYTGQSVANSTDKYGAFYPGVLALAGDLNSASLAANAYWQMWQVPNLIEPSQIDFVTSEILNPKYNLNPETMESNYYLYYFTREQQYLDRATTLFQSLRQYCRCSPPADSCVGYASLNDVATKEKRDLCPSWLFAETFKYLFLTFQLAESPNSEPPVSPLHWVFSTEGHPFLKFR